MEGLALGPWWGCVDGWAWMNEIMFRVPVLTNSLLSPKSGHSLVMR